MLTATFLNLYFIYRQFYESNNRTKMIKKKKPLKIPQKKKQSPEFHLIQYFFLFKQTVKRNIFLARITMNVSVNKKKCVTNATISLP